MKENTSVLHVQVPVDVATYLLNEKRAEIHAIEARLKVSVVLIPNIHLETPNYNITRLRHDDVKLGEIQTSYQLVETPVQEISLPSTSQEIKPARQQAAVRGITPSQPAPIRERIAQHEPEQVPLLDRIFNWFKQMGVAEKDVRPEQITATAQRPERVRGRRDRGREGRDGEYEKTPRVAQHGRDDRAERGGEAGGAAAKVAVGALKQARESTPQRAERSEAKPQGERFTQKKNPRTPREEKIRTELKLSPEEQQPATEDTPQQQGEDSGRRRRRGGRQRDRGERSERHARESKQGVSKDAHLQREADEVMRDESPVLEAPSISIQETSALILTLPPMQGVEASLEATGKPHSESSNVDESEPVPAPPSPAKAPVVPILTEPEAEPEAELLKRQRAEFVQEPAQEPILERIQEHNEELVEKAGEKLEEEPVEEPAIVNLPAAITNVPGPSEEEIDKTKSGIAVAEIEAGVSVPEQLEAQPARPTPAIEPLNLAASGLIMIETLPEKVKPAESGAGGEPAPAQRRRKRTPPPTVMEQDEPLVQIETHK